MIVNFPAEDAKIRIRNAGFQEFLKYVSGDDGIIIEQKHEIRPLRQRAADGQIVAAGKSQVFFARQDFDTCAKLFAEPRQRIVL